ncbi:PHP domain-containing protein [Calidifontibacter sp. DB0510]|uniref:PHP domain-containing protein n=1 Tax=Metallococcus carri TaxID=1656884 RepID=A0A967B0F0_9MICO|nr:PHP domain-containing protein [Metallococcus carri]NHN56496.1 PHP domain-containing protein [Metallococcus carri]NOP36120.1 PHP domain-containing protein [Calidifontibacter sp. DB2511S]
MLIDLHAHSTASDGTQPPAQVVRAASDAGLDVVALTDHDTTAGWADALAAAQQIGVGLVRGIEVSTQHEGISLHVLGYLHDPTDQALLAELEHARSSRETRAQRMVERLAPDTGLTWPEVLAQVSEGTTIGRPHIADALVARGVVADRNEAFASYLATGSKYHVSHYAPDPVTAVGLIGAAGGVAVMAHPFASSRGRIVGEEVIEQMAEAGLAGLEVDHRDHDAAARERAAQLATRLGLIATGSSDYHGADKSNRLGENTTSEAALRALAERATSGIEVWWG